MSESEKAHRARIDAMRSEHEARMVADKQRHRDVMTAANARLDVILQRNRDGLIAWLEQHATDEQVAAIIGRINRGEL